MLKAFRTHRRRLISRVCVGGCCVRVLSYYDPASSERFRAKWCETLEWLHKSICRELRRHHKAFCISCRVSSFKECCWVNSFNISRQYTSRNYFDMIFFSGKRLKNPLYGEKDGNLFLERIWMEMELLVGDIASALQCHFQRENQIEELEIALIFLWSLQDERYWITW